MERREYLEEEDFETRGPLWSRITSWLHRGDEEDEDYVDEPTPIRSNGASRGHVLRLDPTRANAIFVRLDFRSMDDAQAASDRLKERRAVIVNFERSDEDIARRGIDFISGVTYALDGYYQKVGDKVFLFTPSNTAIAVEDDSDADRVTYGAYGVVR